MSMSDITVKPKSSGPEGATLATPRRGGVKIRLQGFMLEDYLDSVAANEALRDPQNTERVSWQQVKDQLGL